MSWLPRLWNFFLEVKNMCSRYLQGAPTLGLCNAIIFMVIRLLNPFLLTQTSTFSSFFENQPRTLWLASRRIDDFSWFFTKLLLQKALEIFLGVVRSHPRYLEGPPTSGLCNAPTLMVIRPLNPFLFKKQFNPPPRWWAVLETASLYVF